jgi:hypothetical protein
MKPIEKIINHWFDLNIFSKKNALKKANHD